MRSTRDFAQFIKSQLAKDPELAEEVEDEAFNSDLATKVYEARTAAGLSQQKLAELVGTQQSVISRIEDADYRGHSLKTLKKIAKALGLRLRVEFYAAPRPLPVQETQTFSANWGVFQSEWPSSTVTSPTCGQPILCG